MTPLLEKALVGTSPPLAWVTINANPISQLTVEGGREKAETRWVAPFYKEIMR